MRAFRKLLVGTIGALSLVGLGSASVGAHSDTLLEFNSMSPVTGAAVGAVNDRGLTGGGLPWVIKSGRGEVDGDGQVSARVKGLIIVVAPVNGKNPIANFSATVSCITPGGIVNVTSGLFPASSTGNSKIKATVTLPSRCDKPELFVGTTTKTGAFVWFAESNAEDED